MPGYLINFLNARVSRKFPKCLGIWEISQMSRFWEIPQISQMPKFFGKLLSTQVTKVRNSSELVLIYLQEIITRKSTAPGQTSATATVFIPGISQWRISTDSWERFLGSSVDFP